MPLHLTVSESSFMALNSKLVFDFLEKRTVKIPIDLALLFHLNTQEYRVFHLKIT